MWCQLQENNIKTNTNYIPKNSLLSISLGSDVHSCFSLLDSVL